MPPNLPLSTGLPSALSLRRDRSVSLSSQSRLGMTSQICLRIMADSPSIGEAKSCASYFSLTVADDPFLVIFAQLIEHAGINATSASILNTVVHLAPRLLVLQLKERAKARRAKERAREARHNGD